MTTVRFDLEPHQWPPHAHGAREGFADAVFWVEWDGAQVEIAARWVWLDKYRGLLCFRALDESQIYFVSCWMRLCLEPSFYYALDEEKKLKTVRDYAQGALKKSSGHNYGQMTRHCLGASQIARWLFVTHDREFGAWSDPEFAGFLTSFRLDEENDLAIENPDSPAGFALYWSQLSYAEQVRRALCFANGDWREFQEIARATVYFGTPSFATDEMFVSFNGEFRISDNAARFHNYSIYDAGVRLRRWSIYIQKYFAPHRNEELAARHLCVAEQSLSPYLQFALSPPTQHERLEAALTLRAWATGKVPERELRLLLPKM